MIIDVIFLILLIIFIYRGYKKGFIVALFAVISIIIGIFCALKCSDFIAGMLFSKDSAGSVWVTFLSYLIVFVATVWLIRLGAKAIGNLMDAVFLGWINRLSGAVLYAFLVTFALSTFVWFVNGLGIMDAQKQADSHSYKFLVSFAPKIFSGITTLMPFLKDSFHNLTTFFESIKAKV